ncbi:MarR family winged helix-turn-helix transcriptional regulator [Photobacterium minamisatsumaniensis]|uniref:MarR family winged helix-turn-helix transcriptional regulator n=1 Tax=Photobacterium minamisatsumaniensis TaxID=2910233 RepID=UPI003D0E14A6
MKQDNNFDLHEFFPYKIVRVADLVSRGFSEIYIKEYGISRVEWRLIASIGSLETAFAKELVEHTSMDKVKVSRGIQKLVDKSLVEKQVFENDLRSVQVSLSVKGKSLYNELIPRAVKWESELFEVLSASEYKEMYLTLNRLAQRLEYMKDFEFAGEET